ncbi:MAG: manganese efflux pump MntP family protein [Wujia sp.]
MEWSFLFVFNSVFLGIGLAMDAFSVSMVNGLHEHDMRKTRMCGMASVYAGFQFIMPMIGWFCVHTIIQYFEVFEKFIPWIALVLLLYIGGKMIIDALREEEENPEYKLGVGILILQGIATSIDAFSVGFTIADYKLLMAFMCCLIVAFVTFVLCIIGLIIGKKFGTKFANKSGILGGIILIGIGIEIFVKGVFF